MTKKMWVLFCFVVMMDCYLVLTSEAAAAVVEKEEAPIPVTTMSPPEGNTTFLDGTTWCVALAGVAQADLQNALDWACGEGKAECSPIQSGGNCFNPDTLVSHASYAFNTYYQQNGNSDIACNFGGTATLTKINPSYEKCIYASVGSARSSSSAPSLSKYKSSHFWSKFALISLFLYLRS